MSEKPMFSLINSNLPVYFSPALVDIILKYYCGGDFLTEGDYYDKSREKFYYAPASSPSKYNLEKEKIYNYIPFMYLVYLCEINIDKCKSFSRLRSQIRKWFRKCSNADCHGQNEIICYGMDMNTWKPVCYCRDCFKIGVWWTDLVEIGNTNIYSACIGAFCSFELILFNMRRFDRNADKWIVKCAF